jgi:hypothetical protein
MARENIFKTNSDVILGFGVELEMGIEPNVDGLEMLTRFFEFDDSESGHQLGDGDKISFHGPRFNNRDNIHEFLANYLTQSGLPAVVGHPEHRKYDMWQVDDDDSVMEAGKTCSVLSRFKIVAALTELPQIDRVEVVSPILGLPTDKPDACSWTHTLEKLFGCIERYFHIVDASGTSTHLHVGPVGRPWSRAEIVSIGEGINLISDIIPVLPRLADTEMTAKWAKMNPQGAFNNSSTIRSVVQSLCPDRNVAWNLRPIFDEPNQPVKGTIEFQQPPHRLPTIPGARR